MRRRFRGALLVGIAIGVLLSSIVEASPRVVADVAAPASPSVTIPDRVAVRFVTPETGGLATPRFLTERQVAFFAAIESLGEQVTLGRGEYPERYVRTAVDRLVARAMLASLLIRAGSEPPDLPRLAAEARAELASRIGGPEALIAIQSQEGIENAELDKFLFEQVRAMHYLDRTIAPILGVTEEVLRETFRSAVHPFRNTKFEDARARFKPWVIVERFRAAELEFLQSARPRIRIATVTNERAR